MGRRLSHAIEDDDLGSASRGVIDGGLSGRPDDDEHVRGNTPRAHQSFVTDQCNVVVRTNDAGVPRGSAEGMTDDRHLGRVGIRELGADQGKRRFSRASEGGSADRDRADPGRKNERTRHPRRGERLPDRLGSAPERPAEISPFEPPRGVPHPFHEPRCTRFLGYYPGESMSDLRLASAGEFFEAIARRYDREYARQSSRESLAKLVGRLPPRARVLDLGVGTGRELTALLDGGHEVVGLDVSPTMLEICARRARPIMTVCADLWEPLPFANAEFDVVLALHGTLAHPPSEAHVAALGRELARVLRGGGLILLEVPGEGWLAALASSPSSGAFRATRIGADRCVHEDRTAGLAIEATILSSDRWNDLLRESFAVSFEAVSDTERLIIGQLLG